MLQIIQYQKTGEILIEDLPAPVLKPGGVLVRNLFSLISSGTEKTSVETAQASLIGKAKNRPDLVKQVIENVKRDGLIATYEKVKTRLDNYKELGYSSAGIVLQSSVDEFRVGDIVACAGAGYASHAEIIFVPKNLVVKIPEEISVEEAAFTTIGAIALQGVRQADVRIGENVVVIGLGLIGLITVQLLKANGCRVIGLDINDQNFETAKRLGCDECVISNVESIKVVDAFSHGLGIDAVLITAGTKSNEPIELALQFARKKSKVVVVGAVQMNIPRSPFYEKEIDLRISCSYGPGRYDTNYEEKGMDYPIGYVRWTEKRNMEAILSLISQKRIDVKSLITHTILIQDATKAYELILGKRNESHLGILISYPQQVDVYATLHRKQEIRINPSIASQNDIVIGFIGSGNFAQSNLIPHLKNAKLKLKTVVTTKPVNAKSVAVKFGFDNFATDANEIQYDSDINLVFIATRHDSHAKYVLESLRNNKNVFVEKPLAITLEELEQIKSSYNNQTNQQHLTVGYNRRFSEPFNSIKNFFKNSLEPYLINYRINAGPLSKNHWLHDSQQGGRVIGEVCHFVDIMQFITNAKPVKVFCESIVSSNKNVENKDNINVIIKFNDGSVGSISYLANGDMSVPKEYCEIHSMGKTAIMHDFKNVEFYNNGKIKRQKFNGSKGHKEEIEHFLNVINGKEKPTLAFESIYLTTLTTFKILESLQKAEPVVI